MQTGAATVESSVEIPQKIKNESAFLPSDATSGNISEEMQNTNRKEYVHPVFIAALFTTAKMWKQPECPPVDEWIKKLWYIYTVEYYTAERKEFLPFATAWMELESIMLSEISQGVRDKYHMISPLTGT